jgi:hypothetical protein
MEFLTPAAARELFCFWAGLTLGPGAELPPLVEEIVSACAGLPLALKLTGALLADASDPGEAHACQQVTGPLAAG